MAQTLEAMRGRIESAQDLYSVVRVMKALAAANIRQCEKTVDSLKNYSRTIEEGLQIVLRDRSNLIAQETLSNAKLGVIVFGSDQGMCGSFNEQITTFAIEELDTLPGERENRTLLLAGARSLGRLEDAGFSIQELFHLPNTVSGITPIVNRVLVKIEQLRFQQGIDQFLIFHHRPVPPAGFYPVRRQLLPIDPDWLEGLVRKPWNSPTLPTFTMEWHRLFSSLIQQHLFVSLYQAFAESLASENSSRLASMQAAEKNIQDHLNELTMIYHQQRQQGITEELLDIVAGFETLIGKKNKLRPGSRKFSTSE